ncbi:MAG: 50S ribosomal protein L4 [Bdellovibrionaceae bacterium]|nr:50S ribosomal protein L4 [Pseudobdellovibrionaceae bacterium]MDW8190073.1 50S ribosomal protein L4 [Pseudobdellovibrionaceae bacterium]
MSLVVDVRSWDTDQVVGKIDLKGDWADVEFKPHVVSEVVRWQLACRRSGTHMTKTKGLVRGGGKKPFRQKGTGNARQGSIRSPLMPGGGKVFGPVPRTYSYELPKKIRRAALKMVFKSLVTDGKLLVYDRMASDGKTKTMAKKLQQLGLPKALVVGSSESNPLLDRSVRNLANAKYLDLRGVNVFDILKFENVLISQNDLMALQGRLGGEG